MPILSVSRQKRAEVVCAVRVMRRYGKSAELMSAKSEQNLSLVEKKTRVDLHKTIPGLWATIKNAWWAEDK